MAVVMRHEHGAAGSVSRARVVVAGYGQSLREDDGAGVAAAEAIRLRLGAWQADGLRAVVEVVSGVQLLPELASVLAAAELVIFLDARRDRHEAGVLFERLVEGGGSQWALRDVNHFADPQGMLNLCRRLYGSAPEAWLISLPAQEFWYGEGLSEVAVRGVAEGVALIEEWLRRRYSGGLG